MNPVQGDGRAGLGILDPEPGVFDVQVPDEKTGQQGGGLGRELGRRRLGGRRPADWGPARGGSGRGRPRTEEVIESGPVAAEHHHGPVQAEALNFQPPPEQREDAHDHPKRFGGEGGLPSEFGGIEDAQSQDVEAQPGKRPEPKRLHLNGSAQPPA